MVSASPPATALPSALPLAAALAEPFALPPPDALAALLPSAPADELAVPVLVVPVDGVPHAASSNANTTIGANHVLFLILFAPSHE
jgi:hypothetical protein